jgi:hypothetical protein
MVWEPVVKELRVVQKTGRLFQMTRMELVVWLVLIYLSLLIVITLVLFRKSGLGRHQGVN